MSHDKKGGRKSPIDRSNNEAEFPATRVPNVIKREQLETGESKDRVGKSNNKKGAQGGY
jgi:hypothetical protein